MVMVILPYFSNQYTQNKKISANYELTSLLISMTIISVFLIILFYPLFRIYCFFYI